jgi:hypothetical protein
VFITLASILTALFIGIAPAKVYADLKCTPRAMVKCLCNADLYVDCKGYRSSYIKSDEKPNEITFQYKDRGGNVTSLILQNPSQNIKNYYPLDPKKEIPAELQQLLKEKNIDLGDIKSGKADLKMVDVTLKPSAKLYTSPDAESEQKVEEVKQKKFSGCEYLPPTRVGVYKGRNSCVSYVNCSGKLYLPVCPSLGGKNCPSADDCMNDPAVAGGDHDTLSQLICKEYERVDQLPLDVYSCDPSFDLARIVKSAPSSTGGDSNSLNQGGEK